jgi:hypothetical protein
MRISEIRCNVKDAKIDGELMASRKQYHFESAAKGIVSAADGIAATKSIVKN